MQYDENGNDLWAEGVGGDRMDWGEGIVHDYSGHGYLSGYFESSSVIFGDTALTNPTSQNKLFVAKKEIQTTSIDLLDQEMVTSYYGLTNYPNPFNSSTKIKFSLPKRSKVKIKIFNLLGQKIKTLLNKSMSAGLHEVEFTTKDLPSGIYFYRIETGEFQQVRKMVLLK